jgi:hypothetical protein
MPKSLDVLVVRHGPGRGRLGEYWGDFWSYLRESRPGIFARLRFAETGGSLPELEGVGAVLFLLGDPLRDLYPECYDFAVQLRDMAIARGVRVLQEPEALARFGRRSQYSAWREHGIPTPRVDTFGSTAHLRRLASEFGRPFLLRADHGHSQRDIRLVRDDGDLDTLTEGADDLRGVIIEFIDTRQGYIDTDPRSLFARYYHKRRIHVLGDTVRTNHIYFSLDPIVGLVTSTFHFRRPHVRELSEPLPYLRQFFRWKRYSRLMECVREDYEHWERASEHEEIMIRATRALGLTFSAIDYSTLADGSVVLWEANPYPGGATNSPMPRLRRSRRRAEGIFDSLGEALLELVDRPGDG